MHDGSASAGDFQFDDQAAAAWVEVRVHDAVRRIGEQKHDEASLLRAAVSLWRSAHPTPPEVVGYAALDLLGRIVDEVVGLGWGPRDLGELVRRNADPRHVATLAAALHAEIRRTRSRTSTWRNAVAALGDDAPLTTTTADGLASVLQVAALLGIAPGLEVPDLAPGAADRSEHPKLARVRALLAKAESTPYPEEAEVLSAKAQELISRYALGRLVDHARGATGCNAPQIRRVWLDAPYVRAKAALVNAVCGANRCRTVLTERLGFCLTVGAASDLDVVELLVTSLLVQADRSMLLHSRELGALGAPRTRSFRHAFLMAYATRIGQRLQTVSEEVTGAAGGSMLPVLRDHEARVAEAFATAVPHTVQRSTSISNAAGWSAGIVAADLATLDLGGQLTERAV